MPRFSVIIPTYNCGRYILQSVESALAQTCRDFEVIVVDDGSTDNTQELLEPHRDKHHIHYIRQKNSGLAAARNTAIRNAHGAYIALLDADDLWSPDKLEVQEHYLRDHQDVALLCGNAYQFYEDNLGSIERVYPDDYGKNLDSWKMFKLILTKVNPVLCPTTVMARWAIDDVGLYDEKLSRLGCEDRDMSLRLTLRHRAQYLNACLAYYRIRKNGMHQNDEKMMRARYYVHNKIFAQHPQLRRRFILRRLSEAIIHESVADSLYRQEKYQRAIKVYLRCLRLYPLHRRAMLQITKSIVKAVLRAFNAYHPERRS